MINFGIKMACLFFLSCSLNCSNQKEKINEKEGLNMVNIDSPVGDNYINQVDTSSFNYFLSFFYTANNDDFDVYRKDYYKNKIPKYLAEKYKIKDFSDLGAYSIDSVSTNNVVAVFYGCPDGSGEGFDMIYVNSYNSIGKIQSHYEIEFLHEEESITIKKNRDHILVKISGKPDQKYELNEDGQLIKRFN